MALTFAYGSNMDWTQMRARCPSVEFVCIAVLKDHRLAFTRRSVNRGCGVSDVLPVEGRYVWGIVYKISEPDQLELDKSEGFRTDRPYERNSYNRHIHIVGRDGDETKPLSVEIYFAVPQDNPPLPNQEYKGLILSGARHWHLPADYIAELECIEVAL